MRVGHRILASVFLTLGLHRHSVGGISGKKGLKLSLDGRMVPMFDIFSGIFMSKDAVWIEAKEGLAEAYQSMLRIAAVKPGPYFVFSSYTRTCVASVDTSKFLEEYKAECA